MQVWSGKFSLWKPKFLAKILSGCKLWELRKTCCNYRGRIGLVASGTQKIWGTAQVVDSQFKTRAELQANTKMTGLTHGELDLFCGVFGAHAWVLDEVTAFTTPLDWKPIAGCIVWSPVSPSLQVQMRLSAKRMFPTADGLLIEMEMARQQLLHQRRIGARSKPNQKVRRKRRWCDIWPFGEGELYFAWKARQELKDQLDEVPADRREFYFAWKKHTEKVIGILTKMPGHVLREFFEVEIQDSRHKIELEVEQRGAKSETDVHALCLVQSAKKRSGKGLGDYHEFSKRNRIRLLYMDIGQSHICNHCWISHHLTYD